MEKNTFYLKKKKRFVIVWRRQRESEAQEMEVTKEVVE